MNIDIKTTGWMCLLSLLAGMIFTLVFSYPFCVVLLVPYSVLIGWGVKAIFAEQVASHQVLNKFSKFQIESRTNYSQQAGIKWDVVVEGLETFDKAQKRLDVIKDTTEPQSHEIYGFPVSVEWRIAQVVQGELYFDHQVNDLPSSPDERLKKALKKLDTFLQ